MYILRHALFQGIFLTQGSNLDLLHCRWILDHLSYQGSLTECNCILLLKYICYLLGYPGMYILMCVCVCVCVSVCIYTHTPVCV